MIDKRIHNDPSSIRTHSCDSAYANLIANVLEYGRNTGYNNNVGVGSTVELTQTKISFPSSQKYITTRSKFNLAFSLVEVLWILAGRNDVEMLKFYNKNIENFSDDGVTFNAPYGERIFKSFGDQFHKQLQKLQKNLNSRQAVMSIWHPDKDNLEGCKDYACNNLSQLLVRNGNLDWTQIMRSNDLIWGLPYNFVQFISLQQIMASLLGVGLGNYTHFANSSHIYLDYIIEARQIVSEKPLMYASPPLRCNSYEHLQDLVKILCELEQQYRVDPEFDIQSKILDLDYGWRNLMLTICFYCKLKHKRFDAAGVCLTLLTEHSYEQCWCAARLEKALSDKSV